MKLVIVGGVAGGMSAAARARRLDEAADVIVLERGQHPSFANCGLPYYVGGEIREQSQLLVQTPASLKASLNLDVRVGHHVTAVHPERKELTVRTPDGEHTITYDALILAPGATATTPAIPGVDSPRVTTLRTVEDALALRDVAAESASGHNAVVIGAGFIGLEAAEALAATGFNVTVVQRGSHVLSPAEPEVASAVRAELVRLGMTVRENTEVASIAHGADSDTVTFTDGSTLNAHTIVISAGVRPATEFLNGSGIELNNGAIVINEHGQTSVPDVWAVGDATISTHAVTQVAAPVTLAGPANRAGRLVADHIFAPGTARALPHPVGTAIVRVGELTAAITGANSRELTAVGIEFYTLHLHPNNHAGYFPGATQVHLTVHMRKDNGQILGAQATGADGVDKRIDVLATAIRAGLTGPDLIDLDLAYAPPYGSAKDPVNFAGMEAENVLSGQLTLWYPHEYASIGDSALVLDVRRPDEFAAGHFPDAINIPHTQLRERLDEVSELAGGRPIKITCQSGVRSYIAHRILAAHGYDSSSLSGGMLTYKAVMGTDGLVSFPPAN